MVRAFVQVSLFIMKITHSQDGGKKKTSNNKSPFITPDSKVSSACYMFLQKNSNAPTNIHASSFFIHGSISHTVHSLPYFGFHSTFYLREFSIASYISDATSLF